MERSRYRENRELLHFGESEGMFLKRFKKKRSNNNILPINYLNFTNKLSAEWLNVKIFKNIQHLSSTR